MMSYHKFDDYVIEYDRLTQLQALRVLVDSQTRCETATMPCVPLALLGQRADTGAQLCYTFSSSRYFEARSAAS